MQEKSITRSNMILTAPCCVLFLCSLLFVDASLIHEAVNDDSPADIKSAIESGSDINERGPGAQTPLMHAVLAGKEKVSWTDSINLWIVGHPRTVHTDLRLAFFSTSSQ